MTNNEFRTLNIEFVVSPTFNFNTDGHEKSHSESNHCGFSLKE